MYLILEKVMHLLLWMMKLGLKTPLKTYMDQALMGKKLKLNFPNLVLAVEVAVTATADTVVDETVTEAEAGIMEVAGIAIDMMTVVTAVIETEATIVGMTTELEQNHDRSIG